MGTPKFVARFDNGYAKLKAQTTGTAVITLIYDANNSLQCLITAVAKLQC